MEKITEIELERLNSLHTQFAETKESISAHEIQKFMSIRKLESLEASFHELEKELSNKYGEGISINTGTGEITKKKNVEN
jgi:hypothetical protein